MIFLQNLNDNIKNIMFSNIYFILRKEFFIAYRIGIYKKMEVYYEIFI